MEDPLQTKQESRSIADDLSCMFQCSLSRVSNICWLQRGQQHVLLACQVEQFEPCKQEKVSFEIECHSHCKTSQNIFSYFAILADKGAFVLLDLPSDYIPEPTNNVNLDLFLLSLQKTNANYRLTNQRHKNLLQTRVLSRLLYQPESRDRNKLIDLYLQEQFFDLLPNEESSVRVWIQEKFQDVLKKIPPTDQAQFTLLKSEIVNEIQRDLPATTYAQKLHYYQSFMYQLNDLFENMPVLLQDTFNPVIYFGGRTSFEFLKSNLIQFGFQVIKQMNRDSRKEENCTMPP
jgi:hypothetical protein